MEYAEATVGTWSVNGTVGALSFKLTDGRSTIQRSTTVDWTLYLRYGVGVAVAGGILIAVPISSNGGREILGDSKKAS